MNESIEPFDWNEPDPKLQQVLDLFNEYIKTGDETKLEQGRKIAEEEHAKIKNIGNYKWGTSTTELFSKLYPGTNSRFAPLTKKQS